MSQPLKKKKSQQPSVFEDEEQEAERDEEEEKQEEDDEQDEDDEEEEKQLRAEIKEQAEDEETQDEDEDAETGNAGTEGKGHGEENASEKKKVKDQEQEAEDIICGNQCGHCRLMLSDEDQVYECTFDERRGRERYIFEDVFFRACVLAYYPEMYPDQKAKATGDNWSTPTEWACPSCTGCIYTKKPYVKNCKVYYCQHCKSPFLQTQAKQRNMICFFCKLQM